ncbi:MAG: hypothetical protein QHC90_25625 [Shinella sp.]|nr:hypothetical protein [Shinella sp.]
MADFVAVIRRAVDGLTDNTPEMRVKVYEKARGAVRRQLEAMNPRPPEALVQRQLDKLESAIDEVESEHAEALPPQEAEDEATLAAAPVEELNAEAAAGAEAEPVAEPVGEDRAQPVEETEAAEAQDADQPVSQEDHPQEAFGAEAEARPAAEIAGEEREDAVLPSAEPEAAAAEPDVFAAEPEPATPEYPDAATRDIEPEGQAETQDADVAPVAADADVPAAEADREPSWYVDEPAGANQEQAASWQDPVVETGGTDFDDAARRDLEGSGDDQILPVEAGREPDGSTSERGEPAEAARMPSTEELWNWGDRSLDTTRLEPVADKALPEVSNDPAWEWPTEKTAAEPAPETEPRREEPNAWSDLEELIGYDRNTERPEGEKAEATLMPGPLGVTGDGNGQGAKPRSFKAEPRRSRFGIGRILSLLLLLAILGGAGAGYWLNRDAVHAWVAEITASAPLSVSQDGNGAPQSATEGRDAAQQPADGAGGTANDAPGTGSQVASADNGNGANGKFTQRLLADGTETDEGPAPMLAGAEEEGKSVAEQSQQTALAAPESGAAEPGTPAAGAAEPMTEAAEAPADAGDASGAAAGEEQAPVAGTAQRMFLYEERLGQTGPTAIEGTVAWSTADESADGASRPEPVIRAQINVPSNGLTALLTIRRNTDQSLPASHLVEIVFSLPENFEGGAIESVQRVAMKRTEQDRGDPLIAVPAKITEDFHMIALNDYPEAIATNTDLLRTRNWIDIPITYRNGRRALLTLDKGPAGTEAFDTAMRAWAALGNTANSQ